MVTYFNRKDMVEFGNYLLSEKRKMRFRNHPEAEKMGSLEERLSQVHHADVANWLDDKRSEKVAIDNLHKHLRKEGVFDR